VKNEPQNFTEMQGPAKGLVAADVAIKEKGFYDMRLARLKIRAPTDSRIWLRKLICLTATVG
jgi:hypothetical protein